MSILSLCVGLVLLVGGGELLIRGASALALRARIPPAIVGLTIVAAGTSAPELVVSLSSALRGTPDLAVGNVVGSNIYNIGLILGLSALLSPLRVQDSAIRQEGPVLLAASGLLWLLAADGLIGRADGALLAVGAAAFIAWQVRRARREPADAPAAAASSTSLLVGAGLAAVGLGLLAGGAELFVQGAVSIARLLGVSERIIGLTIVSVGTSLPELFASLAAALRGQSDLALSNVTGSNIFNILFILGITGLVVPLPVSVAVVSSDLLWMVGFAALLMPIMWSGMTISRREGAVLLALAAGYTALLLR